ncbi:MAG: LPS export ABC transporter ATP-binding protein [Magnetococcales bacterium]|nr:LPS export ABC transporter ATP-binding protein [Magnetococcales bacterium]
MLEARGVCKLFRGRKVVDQVDLAVALGEVVGLLGPNGAGKTTTFYMLTGLIAPDAGSIWLGERDLTAEPMHRRARMGISYLPQEPSVFRRMTVRDNILAILETRPLDRSSRMARLESLLEDLGIAHVAHLYGYALSGGERRRVEVARALAIEPCYVLLDEPFAGVDPLAVEDIQAIIRHLKQRRIGILITDHNVRETLGICDRACIMAAGRVLASGRPDQIVQDQHVRQRYLGDRFNL